MNFCILLANLNFFGKLFKYFFSKENTQFYDSTDAKLYSHSRERNALLKSSVSLKTNGNTWIFPTIRLHYRKNFNG